MACHCSGSADDVALVSNSLDELQIMMNKFSDACIKFGIAIHIKKTVVMSQGTNVPPKLYVNNEALDSINYFILAQLLPAH